MMSRVVWFLVATLALTGCNGRSAEAGRPGRTQRIDGALASAAQFLVSQQSADGAWRSDTYGAFKDGPALTPFVLWALERLPPSEQRQSASAKGFAYLLRMVQPDHSIAAGSNGLNYPVYTSAFAVLALKDSNNEVGRSSRKAWLSYLRQRQLTEELGWQPADRPYGGWGYATGIPRKPRLVDSVIPLNESNLSGTAFAISALRAAGCTPDDPALKKALVFVERCQNYRDDPKLRDPTFDDGGFFFIYDDPVRNKAGVAGTDVHGQQRFASYGSTTTDGLRALLACGLTQDHPRVVAAQQWLEKNFSAKTHPGNYAKDREINRGAVYYYYCCSVSQALKSLGVQEWQSSARRIRWADALADAILKRQQQDGSWSNPSVAVREDDPLVATCLAAAALATCRDCLGSAH